MLRLRPACSNGSSSLTRSASGQVRWTTWSGKSVASRFGLSLRNGPPPRSEHSCRRRRGGRGRNRVRLGARPHFRAHQRARSAERPRAAKAAVLAGPRRASKPLVNPCPAEPIRPAGSCHTRGPRSGSPPAAAVQPAPRLLDYQTTDTKASFSLDTLRFKGTATKPPYPQEIIPQLAQWVQFDQVRGKSSGIYGHPNRRDGAGALSELR